jgi:membrane protein YqaA with SNARE-associated domain
MHILESIGEWLRETLLPYGGFGLFALAICDSSFLSLPEVNDVLLMVFSIEAPERMMFFAACTTAGSVIGCLMLFSVGRKGGEAFLRRKLSGERMERFRGAYRRWGVLAVLVPSLLPPPTPFKIFVLSAGAFGVPTGRFTFAVIAGRSIRYFGQGILAVAYGEAAIDYVRANAGRVGIGISIAILVVVLGVVLWRQRERKLAA